MTVSLSSYLRLARLDLFPVGLDVAFWPLAWGVMMAARSESGPMQSSLITYLGLAVVGAAVIQTTICVHNDICDVKYDALVERTKTRPLVTGSISVFEARAFLCVLVVCWLCLISFLDWPARIFALVHIFPLHTAYPFMKRVTYWPQAWLGLCNGWSWALAWVTVKGYQANTPLICGMVLSIMSWVIFFDTIYACQDIADDVKAGVKSTALLFGRNLKPMLVFFGYLSIVGWAFAGYQNGQGTAFYVISIFGSTVHITWQIVSLKVESPDDCGSKFVSNRVIGFLFFVGLIVDYYIASS